MDAAATLFIARGIDATTIDDIVAAADVAKGTFYHYFTAKTDVVVALRDRFSQGFVARVAAAVDTCPATDAVARLQRWTVTAVDAYLDAYQLHDVVFHDYRHDRRQSQEKDAVIDQIVEILAVGIQAGTWLLDEPRAAAMVIFHGMHGVVDDAIAVGNPDRARIVHTLTTLFSQMLQAGDRPA
ncbi:MAG TPA: TetR/AcrR family transcriptional regulator [Vineibacter sp.]|nr:TetR/AcrR family transcriptional regulator [Vineibacter sp.]